MHSLLACMDVSAGERLFACQLAPETNPPLSPFAKGGLRGDLVRVFTLSVASWQCKFQSAWLGFFVDFFRVEHALGDDFPIVVGVLAVETTTITFVACGAAYLMHL